MFNVHHRSERQQDVGNPATIAFLKLELPDETEKCRHFFLPDKYSEISISPSTPVRHEAGSTPQHWRKRCFDLCAAMRGAGSSSLLCTCPAVTPALLLRLLCKLPGTQGWECSVWAPLVKPSVSPVCAPRVWKERVRRWPCRKRVFAARGGSTVGWC